MAHSVHSKWDCQTDQLTVLGCQ